MKIDRHLTKTGETAYAAIDFAITSSEIRNPDGTIVFRLDEVEVPSSWSQVASDVIAQKYFRKAGVPAKLKKVREKDVPEFLWRSVADEKALEKLPGAAQAGFDAVDVLGQPEGVEAVRPVPEPGVGHRSQAGPFPLSGRR